MPRANRRRREESPLALGRLSPGESTESFAGRRWKVRRLSGASSTRDYVCPGCDLTIPAGQAHVVVWPVDGVSGVDHRRHWHTRCWDNRERWRPVGALH